MVDRDRLAVICLALAALGAAAGAHAQAEQQPVGVPAHEMLEDPFNRAVLFDKLEAHDTDDQRWDATVWAGYAFNRLALRTEGERVAGSTERAELQLLWTHAATRWWDIVAGGRVDFAPGPSRTWAAFGVQGLAPYRLQIEATAFVGASGDSAARFKGEYELLITNRLILQPQLELNWYGQSDPRRRVGAGLASAETGLRLRYELKREIAPYVGLVRERRFGTTADLARSAALDPDDTSLIVGVRLRF